MLSPEKILILRLSSIGDIVLTSPVIRTLRKQFPAAQIDFVVKKQFLPLVRNHPALNRIYELDSETGFRGLQTLGNRIRDRRYDLVIDLHKNFRSIYLRTVSGARRILRMDKQTWKRFSLIWFRKNFFQPVRSVSELYLSSLHPLGIRETDLGTELFLSPESLANAKKRFRDHSLEGESVVAICPGAGFWNKRWISPGFAEVAKYFLKERQARIVLFGGPDDFKKCHEVESLISTPVLNWCGLLNLEEFAACLAHCSFVISNDSGAMHLAAALRRNVVAVFGATTRELGFFPQSPQARVVEMTGLDCRPCTHIGRNDCPRGHFRCMAEITPEMVIGAVQTLSS